MSNNEDNLQLLPEVDLDDNEFQVRVTARESEDTFEDWKRQEAFDGNYTVDGVYLGDGIYSN